MLTRAKSEEVHMANWIYKGLLRYCLQLPSTPIFSYPPKKYQATLHDPVYASQNLTSFFDIFLLAIYKRSIVITI